MNETALNTGGTYYRPDGSTTTGRTVGIFNAADGIPRAYPPIELFDPGEEQSWLHTYNVVLTYNSGADHVGTTAGDEIIWLGDLTTEVCQTINQRFHGTTAISPFGISGALDRHSNTANLNGTYGAIGVGEAAVWDVGLRPPVCAGSAGDYWYVHIVREN